MAETTQLSSDPDLAGLLLQVRDICHDVTGVVVGWAGETGPRLDELLVAEGIDTDALIEWTDGRWRADRLFAECLAKAEAVGERSQTPLAARRSLTGSVLMVSLPERPMRHRGWWMAVFCTQPHAKPTSLYRLRLALQHCQAKFDVPCEPDLGRLVLGWDHRLVHVDPLLALRFSDDPQMLAMILAVMSRDVAQWWTDLADGESHDLTAAHDGASRWIALRRQAVVAAPHARRWHLEIRPLATDDLPVADPPAQGRLARALGFIHDNYFSNPSLHAIAAAAATSPFHFHRVFSRHMGVSPRRYLQLRQIQMARWLLRFSQADIGDIAAATGFSSHGHFTVTFQHQLGVSPSQYRESQTTAGMPSLLVHGTCSSVHPQGSGTPEPTVALPAV